MITVAASADIAEGAGPKRTWSTIVTPRFRVHYHDGVERLARNAAHDAEEAFDRLCALLGNVPDLPVQIVVTDETDAANGFASVLPYNTITMLAGVPEPFGALGDHDDFMRLLLIHELAHIVHIDTVRGVPWLINQVFGKTLAPNQVQPGWLLEGVAVWIESKLTTGGRIRSALVDMLVRTQIVAGTFPTIDEVSTLMRRWPGGSVRHLFGGRFMDFVARRHGDEVIGAMANETAGRIVPYGLNIVARRITGEDFVTMWDAWVADETKKAGVLLGPVRAEGLRLGVAVPSEAQSVIFGSFGPAGLVAYVEQPDHADTNLIIRQSLGGPILQRLRTSGGDGAFTPDGGAYVAALFDVTERRFGFGELERIDLATGRRTRLTAGSRVTNPHVSPDGTQIVAIAQSQGQTRVVTLPIDGGPLHTRFAPKAPAQIHDPAWSPDGALIAASMSGPSSERRLVLIGADGAVQTVTSGARDHHPAWTPDGRHLVFHSDRGGIFNLHRVDIADGHIERLSNVETGAFNPSVSPDGRRILFSHATADGYELRVMALAGPTSPPSAVEPRGTITSSAATIVYPSASYSPWQTLIPKAWLPTAGTNGLGGTFGLTIVGGDAVGHHSYQLRVDYGVGAQQLGYGFNYTNRMLTTPFRLSSSLSKTRYPGAYWAPPGRSEREETIFRLATGLEIPLSRWDAGHTLSLGYAIELRRGITPPPDDPFQPAPNTGGDLTLGAVSLGWHFNTVRSFTDSISAAEGLALGLSLRLNHPAIGSDLTSLEVGARLSGYVTMPWLQHHVLATRVAASVSAGSAGGRAVYALGGLPVRNIFADVAENIRFGADVVRGYAIGARRGASYYLASAEYRFGIWTIERGIDTIPVFFDRVHGAVFVDAGDTPNSAIDLSLMAVGVGAEVRVDLVFGYILGVSLRFGYARGLAADGIDNIYLVLGRGF